MTEDFEKWWNVKGKHLEALCAFQSRKPLAESAWGAALESIKPVVHDVEDYYNNSELANKIKQELALSTKEIFNDSEVHRSTGMSEQYKKNYGKDQDTFMPSDMTDEGDK